MIPEHRGGGLPAAYIGKSSDLAHERLGHRIVADKAKLEELGITVSNQRDKDGKCDICEKAKHHHISFPKKLHPEDRDYKPFELVYVDYAGPVE